VGVGGAGPVGYSFVLGKMKSPPPPKVTCEGKCRRAITIHHLVRCLEKQTPEHLWEAIKGGSVDVPAWLVRKLYQLIHENVVAVLSAIMGHQFKHACRLYPF
jgi:hypothetical protein